MIPFVGNRDSQFWTSETHVVSPEKYDDVGGRVTINIEYDGQYILTALYNTTKDISTSSEIIIDRKGESGYWKNYTTTWKPNTKFYLNAGNVGNIYFRYYYYGYKN